MGRMLDILRPDRGAGRTGEGPHTFTTDWEPGAEQAPRTAHEEAEVPFIEVGAHQWFEASPGVLATTGARDRAEPGGEAAVALAAPPRRPAPRRAEPQKVFLREVRPTPPARFAGELVALHVPDHPVSQQYRDLIGEMLRRAEVSRAILLTAARSEAGTTTTLLNLAASAAHLGRSVVTVDANLRRPGIAERLGLPEAPGLRELLAGVATVEQAARATILPRLCAIAAGLKPAAAVPSLPAEAMRALLARLRERFELVLVDAASWDGRPEIAALGRACDAVYLVLPEAEGESREAASLAQLIPEQGACLAGCILSRY
jgi:Mrp family chromosome partitioning ATPase